MKYLSAVLVILTLAFSPLSGAFAQTAEGDAVPPAPEASRGTQTLEDILARQRGEAVPRTPRDLDAAAGNAEALFDQLGTRGGVSDAGLWEALRFGEGNVTVSTGGADAGILVQDTGMLWQQIRYGPLMIYGGYVLAGVLGAVAAFFVLRGRIRIKSGRSGRVIPRFSLTERIIHWFTAILFVLLGVSGLILLFGRTFLIPLIGADAFGILASASMQGHNLFGPLFIFAILALFVSFVRGNGFRLVDIKWIFKGGGFLGGHASSYRYNFGEKSWFWFASLCGIVLSVSGVLMLFPTETAALVKQAVPGVFMERNLMQLANFGHGVAAVAFIAFGIGHIYIGTIGMEGALEGMTRGVVDENWAKEHHDLWYEQHAAEATTDEVSAEVQAAAGNV